MRLLDCVVCSMAATALSTGTGRGQSTGGPSQVAGRIIAWNDVGMHCIDPDYSVFAILPPFNTLNTQLIVGGKLQRTSTGFGVTYEGIADPLGSINTTSASKTNFWKYVKPLFGVALAPDVGLTGSKMPGTGNLPQPMRFDAVRHWFQGRGIPLTPVDDKLRKNPFPLMKVTAKTTANQLVASTVTVAPNSRELVCSRCHASGANPYARPASGWEISANPLADWRLNILRLHDANEGSNWKFQAALKLAGYNATGLYATVKRDGRPVLCASCHKSNALPGLGLPGLPPLTEAIHGRHAQVLDTDGKFLDSNRTRTACYVCHPGFDTECLRGAMGRAIGSDGGYAMSCQSCHGGMTDVGKHGRDGWFDAPGCQNCHVGTATQTTGKLRYTTAFDSNGKLRKPASTVFATTPDVPKKGASLYRFSTGHGRLQCAACHGPAHAIYPTTEANDNEQNKRIQGHDGTLTECASCHGKIEDKNLLGGPHGMHPQDAVWAAKKHGDHGKKHPALCQACHGKDSKGTVLSLAKADRTYVTKFGTKTFWRGFRISCYACHRGPRGGNRNPNNAPVVKDLALATPSDVALSVTLNGTDADKDPLAFRIISQPAHGRVAFSGTKATYRAAAGYTGADSFTYAARDGQTDSNLGTVRVNVTAPTCGTAEPYGFGCPGTGPWLPLLSATGCASPGKSITLSLASGRGGSVGVVVLGAQRAALILPGGCALRVTPLLLASNPIPVTGAGPGRGTFKLPFPLPATLPRGLRFTLQCFIVDSGARLGWSSTNGIEVTLK